VPAGWVHDGMGKLVALRPCFYPAPCSCQFRRDHAAPAAVDDGLGMRHVGLSRRNACHPCPQAELQEGVRPGGVRARVQGKGGQPCCYHAQSCLRGLFDGCRMCNGLFQRVCMNMYGTWTELAEISLGTTSVCALFCVQHEFLLPHPTQKRCSWSWSLCAGQPCVPARLHRGLRPAAHRWRGE
jgi:hypothetical protein